MVVPTIHLLSLLLLLILFSLLLVAQTAPINLTSSLLASDESLPWKSPSGEFAFGFRHADDKDQEHFLLAIWFENIPNKTIVWNSDGNNLFPKGSEVELTSSGLTVKDTKGQVISQSIIVGETNYAEMRDTGNFVLLDKDSNSLWESFQNPTDTLLPTQILKIDEKLSSQFTTVNNSKARFELSLQSGGNLVLNTIPLTPEILSSNYYNRTFEGNDTMNSGKRLVFGKGGQLSINGSNGIIDNIMTEYKGPADYYRATLDFDGVFRVYAYLKAQDGRQTSWFVLWFAPDNICKTMNSEMDSGLCGVNSYCKIVGEEGRPSCPCIPGFARSDPDKVNDNCIQERVQKCEPGGAKADDVYDMEVLNNTFWPSSANFEMWTAPDETTCTSSCLHDCTCVVAIVEGRTCWKKKLPLTNGREDKSVAKTAFIKVPKSGNEGNATTGNEGNATAGNERNATRIAIIIVVTIVIAMILIIISICIFLRVRKPKEYNETVDEITRMESLQFDFGTIRAATDNFSDANKLGKVGFGEVYRGRFSNGQEIAVKRLSRNSGQGDLEFENEVLLVAKLQHRNLVRLLGFCLEGSERLLIYEFVLNTSLDRYIFDPMKQADLDWERCYNIIGGIARGLLYLHEDSRLRIVHRDLKAANVLLDAEMTPKISDFGLARMFVLDQIEGSTNRIVGTYGYMAPEFAMLGQFSVKSDIFSFGVLIVETVSGQKITSFLNGENMEYLLSYAWKNWRECTASNVIDPTLRDGPISEMIRCIHIGLLCVQENVVDRPNMSSVVLMLNSDSVALPVPTQPASFVHINVESATSLQEDNNSRGN